MGNPIPFNKFTLQHLHVVWSRFVGICSQAKGSFRQVHVLILQHCCHQIFLYLQRRLQVHRESRKQLHHLCIITVSSLSPAYQMQIQLLFELFRNKRMPNNVNEGLNIFNYFWNYLIHGHTTNSWFLNKCEYLIDQTPNFISLGLENLTFIFAYNSLIVIEISLPGLNIDVGIFDDVVFTTKPLLV